MAEEKKVDDFGDKVESITSAKKETGGAVDEFGDAVKVNKAPSEDLSDLLTPPDNSNVLVKMKKNLADAAKIKLDDDVSWWDRSYKFLVETFSGRQHIDVPGMGVGMQGKYEVSRTGKLIEEQDKSDASFEEGRASWADNEVRLLTEDQTAMTAAHAVTAGLTNKHISKVVQAVKSKDTYTAISIGTSVARDIGAVTALSAAGIPYKAAAGLTYATSGFAGGWSHAIEARRLTGSTDISPKLHGAAGGIVGYLSAMFGIAFGDKIVRAVANKATQLVTNPLASKAVSVASHAAGSSVMEGMQTAGEDAANELLLRAVDQGQGDLFNWESIKWGLVFGGAMSMMNTPGILREQTILHQAAERRKRQNDAFVKRAEEAQTLGDSVEEVLKWKVEPTTDMEVEGIYAPTIDNSDSPKQKAFEELRTATQNIVEATLPIDVNPDEPHSPRFEAENSMFKVLWESIVDNAGTDSADMQTVFNAIHKGFEKDVTKVKASDMLNDVSKAMTKNSLQNVEYMADTVIGMDIESGVRKAFGEELAPATESRIISAVKQNKDLKLNLFANKMVRNKDGSAPATVGDMVNNVDAALKQAKVPAVYAESIVTLFNDPRMFKIFSQGNDFDAVKIPKKFLEDPTEAAGEAYGSRRFDKKKYKPEPIAMPGDGKAEALTPEEKMVLNRNRTKEEIMQEMIHHKYTPQQVLEKAFKLTNNFEIVAKLKAEVEKRVGRFYNDDKTQGLTPLLEETGGLSMLSDERAKTDKDKYAAVLWKLAEAERGYIKGIEKLDMPPEVRDYVDTQESFYSSTASGVRNDTPLSALPFVLDYAHSKVIDPNKKAMIMTLHEQVRLANTVDPRLKKSVANAISDIEMFVKQTDADIAKGREYLDAVDLRVVRRGGQKNLVTDPETGVVYDAVAQKQTGASMYDIHLVQKIANYRQFMDKAGAKTDERPLSALDNLNEIPAFSDVSPNLDSTYLAVHWNDKGKALIRERNPGQAADQDVFISSKRARGQTETELRHDYTNRRDAMEELILDLANVQKAMTTRPLTKMLDMIMNDYSAGAIDISSKSNQRQSEWKKDPVYRSLLAAQQHIVDINTRKPEYFKDILDKDAELANPRLKGLAKGILKFADITDKGIAAFANFKKSLALGTLTNPPYFAANTFQFVPNGADYTRWVSIGKGVPVAAKALAKGLKKYKADGSGIDSWLQEEVDAAQHPNLAGRKLAQVEAFARYVGENVTPSVFKEQIDAEAHNAISVEMLAGKPTYGKMAEWLFEMQRAGGTVSDIAARKGYIFAAVDHAQSTRERYLGRQHGNLDHKVETYTKMMGDLSIYSLGSIEQSKLSEIMWEAMDTGRWSDFDYHYSRAMTDRVLFQYGKFYKTQLQDTLQKSGIRAIRELGTFRFNWIFNDLNNVGNLIRNTVTFSDNIDKIRVSFNKGESLLSLSNDMTAREQSQMKMAAKSLGRILVLNAVAEAVNQTMKSENEDEESFASQNKRHYRLYEHYIMSRLPVRRWTSYPGLMEDKFGGFLVSTWKSGANAMVTPFHLMDAEKRLEVYEDWFKSAESTLGVDFWIESLKLFGQEDLADKLQEERDAAKDHVTEPSE